MRAAFVAGEHRAPDVLLSAELLLAWLRDAPSSLPASALACAGTRVWAYCPPGGLVSPSLAAALDPLVTCIAVGKDSVSRTSSASFERLHDQVRVVAVSYKIAGFNVS